MSVTAAIILPQAAHRIDHGDQPAVEIAFVVVLFGAVTRWNL